jgi:hypothetical protein
VSGGAAGCAWAASSARRWPLACAAVARACVGGGAAGCAWAAGSRAVAPRRGAAHAHPAAPPLARAAVARARERRCATLRACCWSDAAFCCRASTGGGGRRGGAQSGRRAKVHGGGVFDATNECFAAQPACCGAATPRSAAPRARRVPTRRARARARCRSALARAQRRARCRTGGRQPGGGARRACKRERDARAARTPFTATPTDARSRPHTAARS